MASLFNLGDIITGLMVARILIQFVGHTIGLFVPRRTQPEVRPSFKMWLYPLPAILELVGWLYVFASPAFEPRGMEIHGLCVHGNLRGACRVYYPRVQETHMTHSPWEKNPREWTLEYFTWRHVRERTWRGRSYLDRLPFHPRASSNTQRPRWRNSGILRPSPLAKSGE